MLKGNETSTALVIVTYLLKVDIEYENISKLESCYIIWQANVKSLSNVID